MVEANSLLHGQESDAFGDAGFTKARPSVPMPTRASPGTSPCARASAALDKTRKVDALVDQLEALKASIRAKVEHPFRVIKRQFGHLKVRYRGLAKNTAQLTLLFRAVEPVDGAPQIAGTGWTSA